MVNNKMKLAALISGGKDSIYALKEVLESHEVVRLISIESVEDSMFFHRQNIELVKLQSEALNIPLTYRKTEESEELDVLEESIGVMKNKIDGIVSGAIASNYQKDKLEKICKKFGLKSINPLWHTNEKRFMNNLIRENFEVIITKVAAQGLGKEWLGKKLDFGTLKKLEKIENESGIHLAFEGGGAETFVLDCPLFNKKIEIENMEKSWNSKIKSGRLRIEAKLREK